MKKTAAAATKRRPRKRQFQCIEGGTPPCPTCPVSGACWHGQDRIFHAPEDLRRKMMEWQANGLLVE